MDNSVESFMKKFAEPNGTAAPPVIDSSNVTSTNSQAPANHISTAFDMSSIWSTWSPYMTNSTAGLGNAQLRNESSLSLNLTQSDHKMEVENLMQFDHKMEVDHLKQSVDIDVMQKNNSIVNDLLTQEDPPLAAAPAVGIATTATARMKEAQLSTSFQYPFENTANSVNKVEIQQPPLEMNYENESIKPENKRKESHPSKALPKDIEDLSKKSDIDRKLKCEFEEKKMNGIYIKFFKERQSLPIYQKKDHIVDLIERNQAVVISGSTGCGKTTQVAQYILDSEILKGRGSNCRIVCTQPRRISASSVAQRVAEERCEELGNSVGYQVRLEKTLPRIYGSILFCTPGILLQNMADDPELDGISHLLMDEIHERDVTSDFFMAVLKQLTAKRNIKVVLMSATMNCDVFSRYFNNCPILDIPGEGFNVETHFLEDILCTIKPNNVCTPQPFQRTRPGFGRSNQQNSKKTEYATLMKAYLEQLARKQIYPSHVIQALSDFKIEFLSVEKIFSLINHICFEKKEPGAILVFLPGWDSICSLCSMMEDSGNFPQDQFFILALHSNASIQQQQLAFQIPKEGIRKIVVATNVAETSITIDDIVFVIDSGLCKVKRYDARKNITTLETEFVTRANLLQRRGRAGRLRKGVCYHFITKMRKERLKTEPDPEIRRTRIEDLIIKCKLLRLCKTQEFLQKLLDVPPADHTKVSLETLIEAQILDSNEELTPLGSIIAKLPMDHFLGKMIIIATFFKCLDPILSLVSSLSFKDPFALQTKKRKQLDEKKLELDQNRHSDHILVCEAMRLWEDAVAEGRSAKVCEANFLSEGFMEYLYGIKQQIGDCLYELKFIPQGQVLNYLHEDLNVNSGNLAVLRAVICAALYPNVAEVKDETVMVKDKRLPKIETFEDKQVYIGNRSVNSNVMNFASKFLVYFSKQSSANKIFLNDCTMVSLTSLLLFANKVETSFHPFAIIKNTPFDTTRNPNVLKLRQKYIKCFEDFTENPRFIANDPTLEHNIVVNEIVELLTREEENMM